MPRIQFMFLSMVVSASLVGCEVPNGGAKPTNGASPSASPYTNVGVSKVQIISGDNLVIRSGGTTGLSANVLYADNSRDSAVTWSSSDDSIVSINPTTGMVAGVRPGVATLIATSIKDSNKRASVTITIQQGDVVDAVIELNPRNAVLGIGQTVQLQAVSKQSNGTLSPNIIWESSDSSIAVVSNGLVTAKRPGTVTITVKAAGDPTVLASASIVIE